MLEMPIQPSWSVLVQTSRLKLATLMMLMMLATKTGRNAATNAGATVNANSAGTAIPTQIASPIVTDALRQKTWEIRL